MNEKWLNAEADAAWRGWADEAPVDSRDPEWSRRIKAEHDFKAGFLAAYLLFKAPKAEV